MYGVHTLETKIWVKNLVDDLVGDVMYASEVDLHRARLELRWMTVLRVYLLDI